MGTVQLLTRIRSLGALCVAAALAVQAAGAAPPDDVILRAADAAVRIGAWHIVPDGTAAGGSRLHNPNANAPKVTAALPNPASYVELSFDAEPGVPYRLWIRGRAEGDRYENDSVFVQFSDSVTSAGAPTWRIGTTSATAYVLEDCGGCHVQGWGWQDNGYGSGVLGPPVYFAGAGPHTIRIQPREDGLSIDQIVLSPSRWWSTPPGETKNDTTILTGGPDPPPIALVREPYVQLVTDTSATLVWVSREPGPAHVRVGGIDVPASTTAYAAASTALDYDVHQHEAVVTGLAPATTYPYDVFVGGVDANAAPDAFRTAPPRGSGSVRFVIFGDSGTGSAAQQAIAARLEADTFDLAGHAGDVAYGIGNGTGDASHATYLSWFFGIYRTWLRRTPFLPSPGNHDTRESNAWGRAYLDVFVLPADAGAGPYPDHAERYYSYDYGPVHFVVLDTERALSDAGRRAEQLRWLEADLQATTQPWKVAYFHRSPFSSGEHGPDPDIQAWFGSLFERYGVQLVMSGHEHGYERTVPWRLSEDPAHQAVTYVVTGGGGGPLYTMGRSDWTAASASRHHYVRTTIAGCTAQIDAIDATGTIFDAHTLDRCAQATDAVAPTVSFISPGDGATVSGPTTIEAEAADDVQVEKVDLWVDGALTATDLAAPYVFAWNAGSVAPGTHSLQLRAYDIDGRRATASQTVTVLAEPAGSDDIVIHTAGIPAGDIHGNWSVVGDPDAAGGSRLSNPNAGQRVAASAAPAHYFETTFEAQAGVPYHLWLRLKAAGNSYENDSVSVQFDRSVTAAGVPVFRIGTTSATSVILEEGSGANVRNWGWNDNGYGTLGTHIYFSQTGPQTLRVQMREDGVSVDQIVLSPDTYLTRSPGRLKDDATILASGIRAPAAPTSSLQDRLIP